MAQELESFFRHEVLLHDGYICDELSPNQLKKFGNGQ